MKVLSIDVGICNLAYCSITYDEKIAIDAWGVLKIVESKKTPLRTIADSIVAHFDTLFQSTAYDIVLIENQPCMKAPTMKSVQMLIYAYFVMQHPACEIHMVSATQKLRVLLNDYPGSKQTKTYTERKKRAILVTQRYLDTSKVSCDLDVFASSKKKDDLADSFLQAISWLEARKFHSFKP